MKTDHQLILPGVDIFLKKVAMHNDLSAVEHPQSVVLKFEDEIKKMELAEERRQINSILDFYKIF